MPTLPPPAKTLQQLQEGLPFRQQARQWMRSTALRFLSLKHNSPPAGEWIWFPYYHHVLDDERTGFERQLNYLRRWGEYITLDQAIHLLGQKRLGGRYLCITFDDGFENNYSNALPILHEAGAPAAFFLATDYLDLRLDRDGDQLARFFSRTKSYRRPMEFMSWQQAQAMHQAGMTLGAHTCSHPRLSDLSTVEARREFEQSKRVIEEKLQTSCNHFAATWGQPGKDFDPSVHPPLARELGFHTFLTTQRGLMRAGDSPYHIRRDALLAYENNAVIKYFLR